jgi:uncharacterized low-complexity protein
MFERFVIKVNASTLEERMELSSISRALLPKAGFWFETIALASAIAFVLALGIAALGAIAGTAVAAPVPSQQNTEAGPQKSYDGMITDTRCGAKHSTSIGKTAGDCTLVCIHGGEQFALVDGETVYSLEGETLQLKRVAGQRVRIIGALKGSKLSVFSITSIISLGPRRSRPYLAEIRQISPVWN